jgi:hypothetical protein
MSEQVDEFSRRIEGDDVEVHDRTPTSRLDGPHEDDVEAHVQPPRGDDTDHLHS